MLRGGGGDPSVPIVRRTRRKERSFTESPEVHGLSHLYEICSFKRTCHGTTRFEGATRLSNLHRMQGHGG